MAEKKTILLIDDEIDLQQMEKTALESRGYAVETANNGWEALEKLKTLNPHLIILDLTTAKMGGLLFYSKICDNTYHPKFPILILSARDDMAKLFKDFIIDGFLSKPFEIDELLNTADAIVNNRYGFVKTIKVDGVERTAKVCIVDNNQEELKKINAAFLKAGYVVDSAANGAGAIEHIYQTLPDVALINLTLPDMGGDDVIVQLKVMARTKDIKYILYMDQLSERTIVIDKISQKQGVDRFIDYINVQQLVMGTNEILKQYTGGSAD